MKIGYILTTFPCRSETFAVREIDALRRMGFEIIVFAAASESFGNESEDHCDAVYRPSLFSFETACSLAHILHRHPLSVIRLLWLALRLTRSCAREALRVLGNIHTVACFTRHLNRMAVAHIHAYFLSWPGTIALATSVATGRSFSISTHARDIFVEHGDMELKVSHASFVRVCNHEGMDYLKANLSQRYHHKLRLNYHGVTDSLQGATLGLRRTHNADDDEIVAAIGRLIPKKGFDILLKAFAQVVETGQPCRLTLFGDGCERGRLSDLGTQLDLGDRVRFAGWREPEVVLNYVRRASVVVVPSIIADDGDRDGLPNVVLEAFINKTPVIGSDLAGIRDAIENRRTGLLVDPADAPALASAIKELLSDKDMQSRLACNAYELAIQRFDLTQNVAQMAEWFEDVCGREGS